MSTTQQDLERQIRALRQGGIEASRIVVDMRSGTTIERPALAYASERDVLLVHALDRLGSRACDTLNLIHGLAERGGTKSLGDPIEIDSSSPPTRWPGCRWCC